MRNLVSFNASSGKSGNFHFDVLLLLKVYFFLNQKSTEELWVTTLKNNVKFEEELTRALKNDIRNSAYFDPTLENLKLFIFLGCLRPKYMMFELKSTEELCIIILKIDVSFEEKMTCGFISDIRHLVSFTEALKNLKICTLRDFFLHMVYNVSAKKSQRSFLL